MWKRFGLGESMRRGASDLAYVAALAATIPLGIACNEDGNDPCNNDCPPGVGCTNANVGLALNSEWPAGESGAAPGGTGPKPAD